MKKAQTINIQISIARRQDSDFLTIDNCTLTVPKMSLESYVKKSVFRKKNILTLTALTLFILVCLFIQFFKLNFNLLYNPIHLYFHNNNWTNSSTDDYLTFG